HPISATRSMTKKIRHVRIEQAWFGLRGSVAKRLGQFSVCSETVFDPPNLSLLRSDTAWHAKKTLFNLYSLTHRGFSLTTLATSGKRHKRSSALNIPETLDIAFLDGSLSLIGSIE
ncbi:MAG: hypothetical protein ACE5FH_12235, partial [Candidatus Zixiibacteriota bacterium]